MTFQAVTSKLAVRRWIDTADGKFLAAFGPAGLVSLDFPERAGQPTEPALEIKEGEGAFDWVDSRGDCTGNGNCWRAKRGWR